MSLAGQVTAKIVRRRTAKESCVDTMRVLTVESADQLNTLCLHKSHIAVCECTYQVQSVCRSVVGLGRMERLVQITSTLETTSNDAGNEGPMYLSLDGAALDNLEVSPLTTPWQARTT